MSKICAICGKKPGFGNHRSHSMVATKRRFDPNLQRVRVLLKGSPTRAYVCTRCLKGGKVTEGRSSRDDPWSQPGSRFGSNPQPWRTTCPWTSSTAGSRSRATRSRRSSPRRTLGCYGVVGLAAGTRVGRHLSPRGRSASTATRARSAIELHVVVEHGLNLAEVASTVRSQVALRGRAPDRADGRRGRGRHPGVQAERMRATRARARRGRARGDRGEPAPDRRPQRLSGARRRHRHEPDADRARDRRGAATRTGRTTAPASRKEVSRAALMGARGNSGVILSQIVRGATESLAETRRPRARRSARRATPPTARCRSRSRGRC